MMNVGFFIQEIVSVSIRTMRHRLFFSILSMVDTNNICEPMLFFEKEYETNILLLKVCACENLQLSLSLSLSLFSLSLSKRYSGFASPHRETLSVCDHYCITYLFRINTIV